MPCIHVHVFRMLVTLFRWIQYSKHLYELCICYVLSLACLHSNICLTYATGNVTGTHSNRCVIPTNLQVHWTMLHIQFNCLSSGIHISSHGFVQECQYIIHVGTAIHTLPKTHIQLHKFSLLFHQECTLDVR